MLFFLLLRNLLLFRFFSRHVEAGLVDILGYITDCLLMLFSSLTRCPSTRLLLLSGSGGAIGGIHCKLGRSLLHFLICSSYIICTILWWQLVSLPLVRTWCRHGRFPCGWWLPVRPDQILSLCWISTICIWEVFSLCSRGSCARHDRVSHLSLCQFSFHECLKLFLRHWLPTHDRSLFWSSWCLLNECRFLTSRVFTLHVIHDALRIYLVQEGLIIGGTHRLVIFELLGVVNVSWWFSMAALFLAYMLYTCCIVLLQLFEEGWGCISLRVFLCRCRAAPWRIIKLVEGVIVEEVFGGICEEVQYIVNLRALFQL